MASRDRQARGLQGAARFELRQDEGDFEKLYTHGAVAQTILIDALKTLPGDKSDPGVKGRGLRSASSRTSTPTRVVIIPKDRDLSRATVFCVRRPDQTEGAD